MPLMAPSDYLWQITELLVGTGTQLPGDELLYEEKPGGFQCRTCRFATPTEDPVGACDIMAEPIHLDDGCCAHWAADLDQLRVVSPGKLEPK